MKSAGRGDRPILRWVLAAILWIAPLLILTVLWEAVSRFGWVSAAVLPSPTAVFIAGADLVGTGEIGPHLLVSLLRAWAGLLPGVGAGVLLGILMARSKLLHDLLDPFLTLTFPLPKTAFVPIAILWLGVGNTSVIFVVFIAVLMPMIISAYHGAQAVHEHFLWSAQSMGASRTRVLISILIPASLPYILTGLRAALAYSIIVVIGAEMIAANVGIGQFIYLYGEAGRYDYMFAAILMAMAAVSLLDQAVCVASRWLLRWDLETKRI